MLSSTTSTVQKSSGRGKFYSRSSGAYMTSSFSIDQRLTRREHSGNTLGILVHQHYGYRMSYSWKDTFGNRSFLRRFRSYNSVMDFCIHLARCTLEAMASCITGSEEFRAVGSEPEPNMLFGRTMFCRDSVSLTIPPRLDGPWYTVRAVREWQEEVLEDIEGVCMLEEAMLK
jgi:hypothetical protein